MRVVFRFLLLSIQTAPPLFSYQLDFRNTFLILRLYHFAEGETICINLRNLWQKYYAIRPFLKSKWYHLGFIFLFLLSKIY
jgi:hypothetical protein